MPDSQPDSSAPWNRPASSDAAPRSTYLTFFIGREEYAIPLARIYEIVPFEGVTRVPTTPTFVKGLVSLQGEAVPVLDLAEKFGAAPEVSDERRSIVVVYARIKGESTPLGLVVARLGRVLNVAAEQIRPAPTVESLISVEFLTGVIEGDGRLVLCLDIDRILGADESAAVAELPRASAAAAVSTHVTRSAYLCVRVSGERLALSLERLIEILPCGRIAHIPGAAPFVLGATNVRGAIVPVVDVALRYGLSATSRGSGSCLVLIDVDGDEYEAPVGLLVESVEGLVKLSAEEIDRTPPFGTRFPGDLVKGMAPVGGEFTPILDTDRALSPSDGRAPSDPTVV
jgi:purine-binding chemotaxis protein CheW